MCSRSSSHVNTLNLGGLGLAPDTSKINCRVLIFTDLLHH